MGGPENIFIGVTIRGGTKRFTVVDNPTCTVYEEHMVTCGNVLLQQNNILEVATDIITTS